MKNKLKYKKLRDAQGNVMATYEKKHYNNNTEELILSEQHIYGSSRLGMRLPNGDKNYELTNHLGNVLAVVSDQKINNEADIIATYDYYPFGAHLVGRTFESESYRYGFGGHEKDDEVSGNGNHLAFGDYGYDTRLGRRWQLDPIDQVYISNYTAFGNDPINMIDPDGREKYSLTGTVGINQGEAAVDIQAGGFSWFPFGGTEMALTLSIAYDDESGDISIGLEGSHTDIKDGAFEGAVFYGAGTKETKVGSIGGKVGYNHKEGKFVASGEVTPKEETYKTEESGTVGPYTRTEREGEESFSFGLKEVKAGLLILGAKIGFSFDITPSDQKE